MSKNSSLTEKDGKIFFQAQNNSSVRPVVEKVEQKGWSDVNISGDLELKRAFWFEAKARGIDISGYSPSPLDEKLAEAIQLKGRADTSLKLKASDVVNDYVNHVIPKMKREYNEMMRSRKKEGISTTELDRAYNLNSLKGFRKDLDDRFYRVKSSLLRAVCDLEQFQMLGNSMVEVKQIFEDRVPRFVLKDPANSLTNRYTQGLKK